MASKAYLKLMKEIPQEIQQQVDFNMDVAFEIHSILESRGQKAVDLANKMGKSQSEISKWLTGTHNFSMKTIQKIELALGTELMMTKSAKIAEYEAEINTLKAKCEELEMNSTGLSNYYEQVNITSFSIASEPYFSFEVGKKEQLTLVAENDSEVNITATIN